MRGWLAVGSSALWLGCAARASWVSCWPGARLFESQTLERRPIRFSLQRGPHFHPRPHCGTCPGCGDVSAEEFPGSVHMRSLCLVFPNQKVLSLVPYVRRFLGAGSLKNLIDFSARLQEGKIQVCRETGPSARAP